MIHRLYSISVWLIELFDPPPRAEMSQMQKMGRIFLVFTVLTVGSIFLAMVGALAIYIVESGRKMLSDIPDLESGLGIILVGLCVNAGCVFVLFQVRNADRQLISPAPKTPGT